MQEFFNKDFYGNTVIEWLIALLIVFGALVLGKALYWLFSKIIRVYTKRTRSSLDDVLVDMADEPVTFIVTLGGIWYGLRRLNFTETQRDWIDKGIQAVLILVVAWLLGRLLDSLQKRYLVPLAGKTETSLDDALLPIIRRATKSIIWILAIIVALDNTGYDVGALLAGVGIGGLALAMAARDTISNVFGGFTIFADQPFTLHDRIKIAGFDGNVREVGLRSTRLETLDGRIVTIPNSKFSDSPVENISMEPWRKVTLKLGLTCDTSAERIEEAQGILKGIAARNSNLEPKVITALAEFGDFSLNLSFTYYIKKGADIVATQNDVNLAVLREFNAAGLELAFPTQTVIVRPQS